MAPPSSRPRLRGPRPRLAEPSRAASSGPVAISSMISSRRANFSPSAAETHSRRSAARLDAEVARAAAGAAGAAHGLVVALRSSGSRPGGSRQMSTPSAPSAKALRTNVGSIAAGAHRPGSMRTLGGYLMRACRPGRRPVAAPVAEEADDLGLEAPADHVLDCPRRVTRCRLEASASSPRSRRRSARR